MARRKQHKYSKKPVRKQESVNNAQSADVSFENMGEIKKEDRGEKKSRDLKWVYAGIIAAVCILLYARAAGFDYTYADDDWLIKDNLTYNSDLSNIAQSFTRILGSSYYRPVLVITFILEAQIAGDNILFYHITNLLLHLGGSLLVFFVLRKMRYKNLMSLFFGLFFAVHPILTPAAVWISGRNDSLLTVFLLLTFLYWLKFYEEKSGRQWLFFGLNMLFYALALFSKEVGIIFPLIALAYYLLFFKKDFFNKKNIALIIGWGVISVVWLLMRQSTLSQLESEDTIGMEALIKNIPTFSAIFGKIFLPVKMNALSNFEPLSVYSGVAALGLLIAAIIISRKADKKRILFGAVWYLLFLLPSLMVRIKYVDDFFDYAEHRAYLPMLGLIIILIELLKSYNVNFKNNIQKTVGGAVLLILLVRSFIYSGVYSDRFDYWTYFVKMYPEKSRGYYYLGRSYIAADDIASAEKVFQKGVSLNVESYKMLVDLATVYVKEENYEKAAEYARRALDIEPDEPTANFYYGKFLNESGRHGEAVPYFKKAIRYRGDEAMAHWFVELGIAYYELRQPQKAIEQYRIALTKTKDDYMLFSNMGAALFEAGKIKEAEKYLLKSYELKPDDPETHLNLVFLYVNTRQLQKAKKWAVGYKQMGGQLPPGIKQILNL